MLFFNYVYVLVYMLNTDTQRPEDYIRSPAVGITVTCEIANMDARN